jgi:4-amino-4-deoxy-L-arabinose transferase-like glycosyltransferase
MIRFHHIVSCIILIVAACSSAALWRVLFPGNVFIMWILGVSAMAALATGYRYLCSTSIRISETAFLLSLISLTLVLRLWWVTSAGTIPIADFLGYQEYALQVSSGNVMGFTPVMTVFPFKFFYPMFLGGLYWLTTPSPVIAQLLNVVCSVIIAFQVYRLGTMAGGEHTGRLAGLFFALWPSQIAFCSVVAQEHLFQVFFLGALIALLRAREIESAQRWLLWGMLAGASLGIAHVLRPVAIVVVPTILAFVIWGAGHLRNRMRFQAAVLSSAAAGFILVAGGIMVFASAAVNQPLWKSSAGFSLYVGTSQESRGFWSARHAAILDEYSYNPDAVHKASTERAIYNIVSDPAGFAALVATKFVLFWGSDDYGIYYSTVEQAPTESAVTIFRYRNKLNLAAQGVYFFLLAGAAVGIFRARKQSNTVLFIAQSVFLLHVAAFCFLEIQSRYHVLVIPLLMIPAAMVFTSKPSHKLT